MNFYAILFALAAFYTNSTEGRCRCSFKNYKPVATVNLLGTWITYQRYNNGPQQDTKCSFYEVSLNETVPGSFVDWQTNIRGEDNSMSCIKGDVTSTSDELALINVRWTDSTEMPISIVASDFENYLIARACYNYEEYVWIMTRTTKPSKSILNKINAAILEQALEKSKLHRSCFGFKDSELVTIE